MMIFTWMVCSRSKAVEPRGTAQVAGDAGVKGDMVMLPVQEAPSHPYIAGPLPATRTNTSPYSPNTCNVVSGHRINKYTHTHTHVATYKVYAR